jgi:hypothetical protein
LAHIIISIRWRCDLIIKKKTSLSRKTIGTKAALIIHRSTKMTTQHKSAGVPLQEPPRPWCRVGSEVSNSAAASNYTAYSSALMQAVGRARRVSAGSTGTEEEEEAKKVERASSSRGNRATTIIISSCCSGQKIDNLCRFAVDCCI